MSALNIRTIELRHVLAGAYRNSDMRSRLVHAVEVVNGEDTRVLCGRVNLDSIADAGATSPSDRITCERCAKAAAKWGNR